MEKKRILEMLKEDGENLEIPEGISPEKIEEKLKRGKTKRRSYGKILVGLAGAACAALVFLGAYQGRLGEEAAQYAYIEEDNLPESAGETPELVLETAEASDSYDKVYDMLVEPPGSREMIKYSQKEVSMGTAVEEDSVSQAHSMTNLRTEGVDEGSILKNDGKYLYVMQTSKNGQEKSIHILKAERGKLTQTAEIKGLKGAVEFYLQGNQLLVLEQEYKEKEDGIYTEGSLISVEDAAVAAEYANPVENGETIIRVYDIRNRESPRLLNSLRQDGIYETSRIQDGILYTISRFYAYKGRREDLASYVPSVQEKKLPVRCIFLPEEAEDNSYLVITALSLQSTEDFIEQKAIFSAGYGGYYVSEKNLYVLKTKMQGEERETAVFRYAYQQGKIEENGKTAVPGMVDDSFSIDEHEGYLRILTTDWKEGETVNALYILDKDLKPAGRITGLAKGEQIYSARFLGDTAYFVTFRQIDPLFTVDLSNPRKPKITGELKITGFSEYLHFYGENLLLGIGRESDPATGENQGVKLSMFDISNSSKVKEVKKLVLKDYFYSEAFYDYRKVLISPAENIIGFQTEEDYTVYSYDEEKGFIEELTIKKAALTKDGEYQETEGAFIGDCFYLLKAIDGVEAYDLNTKKKIGAWKK